MRSEDKTCVPDGSRKRSEETESKRRVKERKRQNWSRQLGMCLREMLHSEPQHDGEWKEGRWRECCDS